MKLFLASEANIITINGTFFLEVVAFVVMLAALGRWVYPQINAAAERRQKAIAEALANAERDREHAQERLEQAEAQLEDARKQAQEVLSGASRSAEQIRQELRQKGEEEAKRIVESARREIESARQQAIDSVRGEVAALVVFATEKVIGESLDDQKHRKLIDQAIKEVTSGERGR